MDLFPDDLVHLGGDEVITPCFYESKTISQFMKDNNLSTYNELVVFHMARTRYLLQNLSKGQKTAMYWSNE